MNTLELDELLQRNNNTRPYFKGTWPLDVFLRRVSSSPYGMYVFNSKSSSHPGQHWLAFVSNGRYGYFFDSYGFHPSFYGDNIMILFNSLPYKIFYNSVQLQGWMSNVCGDYCYHFLKYVGSGFNPNEVISILNEMGKAFDERDRNVRHLTLVEWNKVKHNHKQSMKHKFTQTCISLC